MTRSKLFAAALLVSIAVNLFLVGGIVYRLAAADDFRRARPLPSNVGWVVRDLSEERQQELAPVVLTAAEEIRPLRREMFSAQRRVNRLFVAEEFDTAALEQAFANLRETADRYQALSHQQTIIILSELTDEERQIAQQFMLRRGPRDGRDGYRGRDHDDAPEPDDAPR